MRWDAIGATIRDSEAGYVAQTIQRGLGGMLIKGSTLKRYGQVLQVDVGGRQAAWIGFDAGNGTVFVEGKGETTPELVDCIRANFPGHSCARLDACEDYKGPGSFDILRERVRAAIIDSRGRGNLPKLGYTCLPDSPDDGRTWGTLTRGGVSHLRMYQPGFIKGREACGPDATRVEGEFRPQSAKAKRAAASMSPVDVWGLSGWSHRVMEALGAVDVPRFVIPPTPYTQDRTTLYLARKFRRFFTEQKADYGSLECWSREMEEIWRLDDEAAAALR